MEKELNELLQKTRIAYEQTAIQENKWFYSIAANPIKQNCVLLVGFNWGARENHKPQETINDIPQESFAEQKDLGSFQRVKKYLSQEDIQNAVQSNFCFFRSKKEDQISYSDLQLSTPLFEEFLTIVKPNKIIGFSSKLRDYLEGKLTKLEKQEIKFNNRTLVVAKGKYNDIPIYFLPHPNAKVTNVARENAWKFCFETPKNK